MRVPVYKYVCILLRFSIAGRVRHKGAAQAQATHDTYDPTDPVLDWLILARARETSDANTIDVPLRQVLGTIHVLARVRSEWDANTVRSEEA